MSTLAKLPNVSPKTPIGTYMSHHGTKPHGDCTMFLSEKVSLRAKAAVNGRAGHGGV
jgi:hypothetical protein